MAYYFVFLTLSKFTQLFNHVHLSNLIHVVLASIEKALIAIYVYKL